MKHKYQHNEEECVEAIRQGDENAFKNLFLTYYALLCNFSWRFTRSTAGSEDLVQDVFAAVWNSRESLDSPRTISVYPSQALTATSLNRLAHQRVVRRSQLEKV